MPAVFFKAKRSEVMSRNCWTWPQATEMRLVKPGDIC